MSRTTDTSALPHRVPGQCPLGTRRASHESGRTQKSGWGDRENPQQGRAGLGLGRAPGGPCSAVLGDRRLTVRLLHPSAGGLGDSKPEAVADAAGHGGGGLARPHPPAERSAACGSQPGQRGSEAGPPGAVTHRLHRGPALSGHRERPGQQTREEEAIIRGLRVIYRLQESQPGRSRSLGMEINNCMLKYAKHTHVTRGTYKQTTHCKHTGCLSEQRGEWHVPRNPRPPGEGEREQDEDPNED